MKYSEISLKILAAKECGLIKTKAQFWNNYSNLEVLKEEILNDAKVSEIADRISFEFDSMGDEEGIVCAFDDDFPIINRMVKNGGDKPFLLFYKGDLSLLSNLNKNVSVIGLVNPDGDIVDRETNIVKELVRNELVIVSGLAAGCDSIAHRACLQESGKTIAILPSSINKVYPASNRNLAEEIVEKGGLLVSEYYKDAVSKQEAIKRFLDRDRLQAMFSKAVILIASYRKNEGDSGSRHAMEAAKKYGIERYVMFNKNSDEFNKRFGLNQDYLKKSEVDVANILMPSSIDMIKRLYNPSLSFSTTIDKFEQLTLL